MKNGCAQTEMVIQQFQELYEHNPKEPVFLFRHKQQQLNEITKICK